MELMKGFIVLSPPPISSKGNVSLSPAPKAFLLRWFICWACDRRGPTAPQIWINSSIRTHTSIHRERVCKVSMCDWAQPNTPGADMDNCNRSHSLQWWKQAFKKQPNVPPSMLIDRIWCLCSMLSRTRHSTQLRNSAMHDRTTPKPRWC